MYPWQDRLGAAFAAYVEGGRIPHALLITGPPGCGKVDLAREFARQLLCLEASVGGCGACRSCRLLEGGAHPDYREVTFELRDKSDVLRDVITVDQIRALIEVLYKTTTISKRKVAIIQPADRMNFNAANALLKTLEEPVGDTVLLLVAHDAAGLPATVRSRCQRLEAGLPALDEARDWLLQTAEAALADADEALRAAAGRPLEALALLENGALAQYRETVRLLMLLRQGRASDGVAVGAMVDYPPRELWTWLSLRCADLVRSSLLAAAPGHEVRSLAELQRLADRNRELVATPVRKDLLLRDWLIQWKNLPATLPLDRHMQEA